MKDSKTTIVGLALAGLIAAEPIISGNGYHLDSSTIFKLVFAVGVAILSKLTADSK
jgi:hypothetical protein